MLAIVRVRVRVRVYVGVGGYVCLRGHSWVCMRVSAGCRVERSRVEKQLNTASGSTRGVRAAQLDHGERG